MPKAAFDKPAWLREIKVLVWDLDQTLYPQHLTIKEIFHDIVAKNIAKLLKLPLEEARQLFQQRHRQYEGVTKTMHSFGFDAYQLMGKIIEQINWENFLKRDEKLVRMFKALQKRLENILLSDNTKNMALKKINLLGLEPTIFKKMFFSLDMRLAKPDLQLYKKVLAYTKLPAATHLMVGDSELRDIRPAKKVGMKTCLVWSRSAVADISLAKVYDVVKLFP